nr:uncharacterized protein LOC129383464 [Dermacentor andersoni]
MAWGSARSQLNGRDLLSSIHASGLLIINAGSPTFVRRRVHGIAIDLSLASDRCHYEWVRSLDTQGSDHYPISLDPLGLNRTRTCTYRVTDWSHFRSLCAIPPPANTNFLTHLTRCLDAATKSCTVPAGTPVPDIKLLNLRAVRRRGERRAIKSDKVEHWTLYNRLDAACRRHARQRRSQSWQSLCVSLKDTRDKSRPWHILASLLRPKIPRHPALSSAVATGLSTEQLAELFADAFAPPPPSVRHVSAPCELPPHNKAELLAPLSYFPARAILEHVEVLCSAEFTLTGKSLEAMALGRIEWIASALDTFAPEQSGFRRLRSAADSLAGVVATLEHAASRQEAGYLVLLDVQRAFDGLPHTTIIQALRELRVTGRLFDYIAAFLSDRTLRVRVGDTLSAPRSVTSGVPQGSEISPFLFNFALARLPDYIPKMTAYEVRVAMYADDIALFACGPTDLGFQVRESLQSAINAVDEYLASIGLQLSASKTEALLKTAALLHERLGGLLLIYTDGSVSTVAELAGIDLAADLLLQQCSVVSAAILSDSRAALCMLAKNYLGPPLVLRVG